VLLSARASGARDQDKGPSTPSDRAGSANKKDRLISHSLKKVALRFLRHDLTVLPHVNGRVVHTRYFPSSLRSPPQRLPYFFRKCAGPGFSTCRFHGPSSVSLGIVPELSYTDHLSAKSL
jgi:hypothetical protein